MTTALEPASVRMVDGRSVLTYLGADGWPAGRLDGYADAQGGFVVEHVMTFRRGVLLTMLRAMIEVGRDRGYHHLVVSIPHAFPPGSKLLRLAGRMGFTPFDSDAERVIWVRYL